MNKMAFLIKFLCWKMSLVIVFAVFTASP